MEFPFDINSILPYPITIFNGDYRILNKGQAIRIFTSEKLNTVIDAIGIASFKAQGLFGAVTTARKFRVSDQRLYIIKETNHNNKSGVVIGILKVGAKHLYVYDTNSKVHERTPLCVLDFYVHESKQRLGYGKRLFDMMLEHEQCAPYELAIDRPSNKCLAFLHKHYNLSAPIHQVNNFVVFHAFFNGPPAALHRKPSTPKQRPESFSWFPTTERQQHRPLSEVIEVSQHQHLGTFPNEHDIFSNRQQPMTARVSPMKDEHTPLSYQTSYGQHNNQIRFLHEQIQPSHSASYASRTHSNIFGRHHPFANIQRNTTATIMPSSYYQSPSTHESRRMIESIPQVSKPESFTSVLTFPSSMKSTNNWRQPQSTIDSSSSAWRLFGVE
ncbi:unnamed protein product [Rotaria magnacalcarata]|uniref:Alpha-tubulin N-acetyltransferase n=3 Tax=Rotaria magnacalcarata TaxID=392030 RepID=A0A819FFP0_9BILA|nr:unnamed protein product [Rotaria magnacalcarata]CAF2248595.1 unnamed protein product [Rotaria magnacalcarata]CAF3837040.1 unnamed protein product [Rotaria magnacalcarata]CAF3867304.1 unnamed protein product [Rotaria magnacalcarata]